MLGIDTSFLVSLFLDEDHSDLARNWLASTHEVILLSELNRLEFGNALEPRCFQKSLTRSVIQEVHATLSTLQQRRVIHFEPSRRSVWETAEEYASNFSAQLGLRTLDIWHVAYSASIKCKQFATFDRASANWHKQWASC